MTSMGNQNNIPKNYTKPLINTHTHIFSYKDVPPFIARSFLPFPLYLLTHFSAVFWLFRQYKNLKSSYYKLRDKHRKFLGLAKSTLTTGTLLIIFTMWIGLNSIYYILDWANGIPKKEWLTNIIVWLTDYKLLLPNLHIILKILMIVAGLISGKSLRGMIIKISQAFAKPLSYLPNKMTLEFVNRYLKIAAIANYKNQATAYNKLYKMYPTGSKFVVLTMDMTYMNLTPPRNYYKQLDEIVKMMSSQNDNYKNIIPFLFVDPRRIQKDRSFFKWSFTNRRIVLEDCKVKEYLEDGPFRGIKIYPALGYYAFDELLLPLWLYCLQEELPITTHCTVGTIYYRQRMKKEWFIHPLFKDDKGEALSIYSSRNADLQKNFTNPLNYLILVEPYFLKKLLATYSKETQDLFGYNSKDNTLERDLSNLKINIAHYGGIEQWKKHQESDRLEYAQEILEMPTIGIRLFSEQSKPSNIKDDKPATLWKKADWYSIISSLMLQYEGIYADISYILHTPQIRPLLNLTLQNSNLAKKVLFGTDYYVVRNHKSEKELYAEMIEGFTHSQMDLMARDNPNRFLKILTDTKPLI